MFTKKKTKNYGLILTMSEFRAETILNIILCGVLFLAVLFFGYNMVQLYKFRRRSFFKKRNINLILLSIIPSAIYSFVLVPITQMLILYDIDSELILFWLLLHVSLLNMWLLSILIRFWYLFVSIKRTQDSLQWKKVLFEILIQFKLVCGKLILLVCLVCLWCYKSANWLFVYTITVRYCMKNEDKLWINYNKSVNKRVVCFI